MERRFEQIDLPEGIELVPNLSIAKAVELRDLGVKTSKALGIGGFLVVVDTLGMQKASEATGGTSLNVDVALAKIKTVLAVRQSSSLRAARMREKGQTSEDFGGRIGSLFGGGVAIFADPDHEVFVGAVAFSGGTQEQDEKICRRTVEESGLYTDLPTPEQQ